jgi:hypothetical protein
MKPSHSHQAPDEDEEDFAEELEDNSNPGPNLTRRPLDSNSDIIECEVVSVSSFDTHSSSQTPGARGRREKFRISDITGSEKARWQRLIEAVTLDYIHMGPESILPGGDGHRQNLDHRKLRRLIRTRYVEFFGNLAPKLEDNKVYMVKWLR